MVYKGKASHHSVTRASPGAPFKVNALQTGFVLFSELIMGLSKRQVGWPVPLTDGVPKDTPVPAPAAAAAPPASSEPETPTPPPVDVASAPAPAAVGSEQANGDGDHDTDDDVVYPDNDGSEGKDDGSEDGDEDDDASSEGGDNADAQSHGATSTPSGDAINGNDGVRIAPCTGS